MIRRFSVVRIAAVILAIAIPFAAVAAPVGKGVGVGSSITWQTNVTGHHSVIVRVLTPLGDTIVEEFPAGRGVSLSLSDLGTDAGDGQYNYEFIVVPKVAPGLAKKLEAARGSNDAAAVRKALKDAGIDPQYASGTFSILNGAFVASDKTEDGSSLENVETSLRDRESAPAQGATRTTPKVGVNVQVIADDLVVQGSECVGIDCTSTESFGFDTIRLKENNLRIKAEDTSTSAGYPATDWQLTFNDSTSGGANKFSVDDVTNSKTPFTVEGNTPSNSLFVDSTGNVGFGTAAPGLDLHVQTTDTPALRLDQTNAGGFTAQTWDIGGNEANFFVRDLTGGSRLSFRIRPGAPTSSIDIQSDGDVGIGTASPETKLHVFGASNVDTFAGFGTDPDGSTGTESAFNIGLAGNSFGRGAGFLNTRPDSGAVAPNPSIRIATANVTRMLIDNEGFIALGTLASTGGNPTSPIHYTNSGGSTALLTSAGVWQDASSRDAKENINELSSSDAFKALNELNPVTYTYKVAPEDGKVGFIAEDVPEIVATPERNGLSALDIVAVVTKVVQEQQKTIEALNARIAQLEAQQQQ